MENIDIYYSILKDYIIGETVIAIAITIGLSVLGLFLAKIARNKYERICVFGLYVIILALLVFGMYEELIPGYKDIVNESIVVAEKATYIRQEEHSSIKTVSPDYASIQYTVDGNTYFSAIINGEKDTWPKGTYECTIVYAKESKFVLDVIFYADVYKTE